MSEHIPGNSHPKAKIAAEIGAASLGLAAAAAGYYVTSRRRRQESERHMDEADASTYRQNLAIFDTEEVENTVKDGRQIMAAAAVRIFYATRNTTDRVITKQQLLEQFATSDDEFLQSIPDGRLQQALGFLKEHHLITRHSRITNPRAYGYCALPSLEWGMEFGDKPDVLAEAEANYMYEQFYK